MGYRKCKDCRKRYPGCQDVCETFAEEKAEEDARKEKILKAKKLEADNRNYIREHYWKERKNR